MVAHPAGKLHALLLEVVKQALHALRRLTDLGACQHSCCGVCHNELQLFHGRAFGAPDENRHFAKILAPFCDQSPNRSRAPVAGNEAVLAILRARDRRRVHNAGERDGIFEIFELGLIDRVKIGLIAHEIVNVDLHELPPGVRLGHRLHLLGKNARYVKRHLQALPSKAHPSSRAAGCTPARMLGSRSLPPNAASRP